MNNFEKYYYNFNDLCDIFLNKVEEDFKNSEITDVEYEHYKNLSIRNNFFDFTEMLRYFRKDKENDPFATYRTTGDADVLNKLFGDYIVPRYTYYYWIISYNDLNKGYYVYYDKLCFRVLNWLNSTYSKFHNLVEFNNLKINELLAPIISKNKRIDNDTPQTSEGENLFSSEYASFIAQNISEADNLYLLDKIEEYKNRFDDVYSLWTTSFSDILGGEEYATR